MKKKRTRTEPNTPVFKQKNKEDLSPNKYSTEPQADKKRKDRQEPAGGIIAEEPEEYDVSNPTSFRKPKDSSKDPPKSKFKQLEGIGNWTRQEAKAHEKAKRDAMRKERDTGRKTGN